MKHLLPSTTEKIFIFAIILTTISAQAREINPKGSPLWRPNSETEKAGFDAGFSNIKLGGYLDFENACNTQSVVPTSYWFRLSNSVARIGTGIVEYGCWGYWRFLHTFTSTAINYSLSNVNCLRVNSLNKNGLIIRAEPGANTRNLGRITNGRRVTVDSFTAAIVEKDGENWVGITSP